MYLTLNSDTAAIGNSRALVRIRTRCGIVFGLYAHVHIREIMGVRTGAPIVDREQAKRLGEIIRQRRKGLELSTTRLAELTDMNQASIVRFELGQILNPDPDKLRAIAEALDLNLSDVLSMAGYPIPTDLPSPGPYLRTKFRNLPAEAVDQLQGQIAEVLRQHGIEPGDGPNEGEDELPEDARPTNRQQPSTNQKGGTP